MALPTPLDRCPISPECTARKLLRDESDGKLYFVNAHKELQVHKCTIRGSEKPEFAYLAQWHNTVTKRSRYIGPVRQRHSALLLPTDERHRGTKNAKPNWKLVDLFRAPLEWESVLHEIKDDFDSEMLLSDQDK